MPTWYIHFPLVGISTGAPKVEQLHQTLFEVQNRMTTLWQVQVAAPAGGLLIRVTVSENNHELIIATAESMVRQLLLEEQNNRKG
ncbi:hypothetical protein EYZ11_000069 [Aspergillus tanneri]|uniref:Uncharacterized protein n=1 Tax=Aspergillus tanneri TaxID=1220188 RepID=A0A4S3JY62_9EURO|nr:hypothetical protein EYZ11_000069 [Aspergillus tanneri]